ncbi:hypothetical protein BDFB_002689 [Asbolus verrucosus]|uniref:HTH 24 domain containing protein n=1 Tax=Asbolus verrucosus TaxID=1661398 RepID=A0A482VN07_ASBVE|nr:hypothetical protein BDFB_002689 [Asbolus verrucosus]
MEATPSKSIKKLSQEIHLSYGTTHTVLKKELNLCPYKVQLFHQILARDLQPRINYCQWFLNNINNDELLDLSFFTDEA